MQISTTVVPDWFKHNAFHTYTYKQAYREARAYKELVEGMPIVVTLKESDEQISGRYKSIARVEKPIYKNPKAHEQMCCSQPCCSQQNPPSTFTLSIYLPNESVKKLTSPFEESGTSLFITSIATPDREKYHNFVKEECNKVLINTFPIPLIELMTNYLLPPAVQKNQMYSLFENSMKKERGYTIPIHSFKKLDEMVKKMNTFKLSNASFSGSKYIENPNQVLAKSLANFCNKYSITSLILPKEIHFDRGHVFSTDELVNSFKGMPETHSVDVITRTSTKKPKEWNQITMH